MVKLVDTLVSGTSVSNDVQVRFLFWAQKEILMISFFIDGECWGERLPGSRGEVFYW